MTGHSSVILATENQVNYALEFVKPILKGEVTDVEVKKDAEVKYVKMIQDNLKKTVWRNEDCRSVSNILTIISYDTSRYHINT